MSAKPQAKNFATPDETLTFPKGSAANVRVGELVVGRFVQQPGWRWSEQVKPIAGTESCQFHAGEILVSSTTRELGSDSGLSFDDRGEHHLKGVPNMRRVFALLD